jgi:LemA protein
MGLGFFALTIWIQCLVRLCRKVMNGSLLLWMTLALTLFWGVGVYNRLMRMRARGLGAFGSVEKHLRQYAELVHELISEPGATQTHHPQLTAEKSPGDWGEQLLAVLQTLDQALKDARAMPLAIEPLARLGEVVDALQGTWRNLHDLPADLAGPVLPDAMKARWEAITRRVETARGGFNQILTKYNEALEQFPARLVVGLMGFKPGGKL